MHSSMHSSKSIHSVATVLLSAGTLFLVGGTASHAADGEPAATDKSAAEEWTVLITPTGEQEGITQEDRRIASAPIITPATRVADPVAELPVVAADETDAAKTDAPVVRYASYRAAYHAIPFNRTEYDANPSYRHDAAMELLFGKMRPTVIHRHISKPRRTRTVATPYPVYPPLYDYSRGPYSSYRGLFGYRGGYRLQYYNHGSYGIGSYRIRGMYGSPRGLWRY